MGTSLVASLATHRSISRYVALLLAPKSHSSCREQNASLIAQSSSFFLLAQETMAFAHLLSGLGPRAFGPAVELGTPSPPINAVNGVARCRDSRSPSEVPYHCHMQGKPYKTPRHKKYLTKIPKYNNAKIYLTKIPRKYHILENFQVPPCSILLG